MNNIEKKLEKHITDLSKIDKLLSGMGYDYDGDKRSALRQSIAILTIQLTNFKNQ
mgnify:FL=1